MAPTADRILDLPGEALKVFARLSWAQGAYLRTPEGLEPVTALDALRAVFGQVTEEFAYEVLTTPLDRFFTNADPAWIEKGMEKQRILYKAKKAAATAGVPVLGEP
jgi:hypothetical protein